MKEIVSTETLASLLEEAVIRDADGSVFEKLGGRYWATSPWTGEGADYGYESAEVALPAVVLYG